MRVAIRGHFNRPLLDKLPNEVKEVILGHQGLGNRWVSSKTGFQLSGRTLRLQNSGPETCLSC